MLKLADLIYRPVEEPLVKIKIVIPSTPVTEFPPQPPTPATATATVTLPKKQVLPARQTPTTLKLSLPSTLPKLKLVSPRTNGKYALLREFASV